VQLESFYTEVGSTPRPGAKRYTSLREKRLAARAQGAKEHSDRHFRSLDKRRTSALFPDRQYTFVPLVVRILLSCATTLVCGSSCKWSVTQFFLLGWTTGEKFERGGAAHCRKRPP